MRRRHWLTAAVGAGAAAIGAGVAWRRWKPGEAQTLDSMWTLKFARPGGGELAMADFRGKPLLINFWATWCVPCIRELPALQRFQREYAVRGWQVLALAIDSPMPVLEFVAKFKLDLTVAMAGLGGMELIRSLGNSQGGLPFSVVIGRTGRIEQRRLGETHYDELTRWAAAI